MEVGLVGIWLREVAHLEGGCLACSEALGSVLDTTILGGMVSPALGRWRPENLKFHLPDLYRRKIEACLGYVKVCL